MDKRELSAKNLQPQAGVVDDPLVPPCRWCGYNSYGYWQPHTHDPQCPWYKIGGAEERQKMIAAFQSRPSSDREGFVMVPTTMMHNWMSAINARNKRDGSDQLPGFIDGILQDMEKLLAAAPKENSNA